VTFYGEGSCDLLDIFRGSRPPTSSPCV